MAETKEGGSCLGFIVVFVSYAFCCLFCLGNLLSTAILLDRASFSMWVEPKPCFTAGEWQHASRLNESTRQTQEIRRRWYTRWIALNSGWNYVPQIQPKPECRGGE